MHLSLLQMYVTVVSQSCSFPFLVHKNAISYEVLDVIDKIINGPKRCHFIIRAEYMNFMPLADTTTKKYTITTFESTPFLGGIYVPAIPNVRFDTIALRAIDIQNFQGAVDRLVNNRVIKGVIVFVNEIFILRSYKEIMFLNYFKDVQPNVPYALGGCLVNDTFFGDIDFDAITHAAQEKQHFGSGSFLTAGLFTVPKDMDSAEYNNFDMFSIVLKTSEWTKSRIEHCIFEFAKEIPKFEHSFIIKFSCVGRDVKHMIEKEILRAAFPNTRIVGCYGNGEVGVNHPDLPQNVAPPQPKKARRDPGPYYGLMYSYSSVIVFLGWGKITHPAPTASKR